MVSVALDIGSGVAQGVGPAAAFGSQAQMDSQLGEMVPLDAGSGMVPVYETSLIWEVRRKRY